MNKTLILAVAAVIGLAGGFYLGLGGEESPEAPAATLDLASAEALRDGDMVKLRFGMNRGSDMAFTHEDGSEVTLADWQGKIVLVNFWATWCAPCRAEMPHLAELQTELGGDDFEVLTIATGRNPRPAVERFLEEIGVDNLPLHADPNQRLSGDFGVFGLPVTLILDREGNEIARMQGDADWASDSAKAILTSLIEG